MRDIVWTSDAKLSGHPIRGSWPWLAASISIGSDSLIPSSSPAMRSRTRRIRSGVRHSASARQFLQVSWANRLAQGNKGQRATRHTHQIAIGNVDRRQGEAIAAVAPALRFDEAEPTEFRQDDGEELGRNVLRRRNVGQRHQPLAVMIRQMLHGVDRVSGLLGKHGRKIIGTRCSCKPHGGAARVRRRSRSRREGVVWIAQPSARSGPR